MTGSKEEADCNSEIQLAKESKKGSGSSEPGTLRKLNQDSHVQESAKQNRYLNHLKIPLCRQLILGKKAMYDVDGDAKTEQIMIVLDSSLRRSNLLPFNLKIHLCHLLISR